MRIEQLGTGAPEVVVVGGIHGDEPCGVNAIERLLADDPTVKKPVKLIIANEQALGIGARFIDADLNRSFDTGADPSHHEYHLAQTLSEELADCTVLSIHSTQSYPEPFGIVADTESPAGEICPFLSIVALVELSDDEGRLFAIDADLIEVEAGPQGTEKATENAYRITREYLTATGVLPGRTIGHQLPVYRLGDVLLKPPADSYEVYVDNFSHVNEGEAFAAADNIDIVAEEPFYPILMSPYGYEDRFGYTGQKIGVLNAPSRSTK